MQVAKNYVRSYNFSVDLISTIPISELSQAFSGTAINSNYTRIFKQLKLFRILRLAKLTKFLQNENLKTFIQIFKMFFLFVIIVTHYGPTSLVPLGLLLVVLPGETRLRAWCFQRLQCLGTRELPRTVP